MRSGGLAQRDGPHNPAPRSRQVDPNGFEISRVYGPRCGSVFHVPTTSVDHQCPCPHWAGAILCPAAGQPPGVRNCRVCRYPHVIHSSATEASRASAAISVPCPPVAWSRPGGQNRPPAQRLPGPTTGAANFRGRPASRHPVPRHQGPDHYSAGCYYRPRQRRRLRFCLVRLRTDCPEAVGSPTPTRFPGPGHPQARAPASKRRPIPARCLCSCAGEEYSRLVDTFREARSFLEGMVVKKLSRFRVPVTGPSGLAVAGQSLQARTQPHTVRQALVASKPGPPCPVCHTFACPGRRLPAGSGHFLPAWRREPRARAG